MICETVTESIFLVVMTIITALATTRLFYFIVNQDKILKLIREIGVHRINDTEEEFHRMDGIVNVFVRFASYYLVMSFSTIVIMVTINLPIFSMEKRFPFNVFIPLDWSSNETYYWIIYIFVSYNAFMSVACILFNVIIWYLMLALALEYDILGNEFRNMGWINETTDSFHRELISLIKKHRNLQE